MNGSDDRMLPQVNWDAIQTEIWRRHARELRALLDRQNKELYEVARERDRLLILQVSVRTQEENSELKGLSDMATKFKTLSMSEFTQRYPEADINDEALEDLNVRADAQVAKVKIPGHGWCACLVQDGRPVVFHDEDDGWAECPAGDYEQVR